MRRESERKREGKRGEERERERCGREEYLPTPSSRGSYEVKSREHIDDVMGFWGRGEQSYLGDSAKLASSIIIGEAKKP